MRIGYACLTEGIPDTKMRTCIMKNATGEKLYEIIENNLSSLKAMLIFNAENDVRLFRISSDIIPFGSSPVNNLKWQDIFSHQFKELSEIISQNKIRVSMHPGQYTVLNSPNPDVVSRAIDDLMYHEKVLDTLNTGQSSKIILHLGGAYGDKAEAIKRFEATYQRLPESIKKRLVIENDDKIYNINEVLGVGLNNRIPVVYDNLHSEVNPYGDFPNSYWIKKASETWSSADGRQKTHYSQQAPGKSPGAHTQTIAVKQFMRYLNEIGTNDIDIMLEVKDKNISAVKCINTLSGDREAVIKDWERYKYKVLELCPGKFYMARKMLGETQFNPAEFYTSIEDAFTCAPSKENILLAAQTIWEEFTAQPEPGDKARFRALTGSFSGDRAGHNKIKKFLSEMGMKYDFYNLINSFYLNLKE